MYMHRYIQCHHYATLCVHVYTLYIIHKVELFTSYIHVYSALYIHVLQLVLTVYYHVSSRNKVQGLSMHSLNRKVVRT